jgi:hypothetical protein
LPLACGPQAVTACDILCHRVIVVPNEVTATQAFLPEWPRLEDFSGGLRPLLELALKPEAHAYQKTSR